jgi:Flp pilus assembly pilin Flp
MKLTKKLWTMYYKGKNEMQRLLTDERGEVNLVVILLLIVVAVGLVVVFRKNITALIDKIFTAINGGVDDALGGSGASSN